MKDGQVANRSQSMQASTKAWEFNQGPRAFKRKISYMMEDDMEVEDRVGQRRKVAGGEEEEEFHDV